MFDVLFLILEEVCGIIVDGDGIDFVACSIELTTGFTSVVFSGNFFHNVKTISYLTKY